MTETKTTALRAVVSFNGLNERDIIHVDPNDPYYASLLDGGFLTYAYPDDDPMLVATILNTNTDGEMTTVLGVAPAPARARRTRAEKRSDGDADPESA